MGLVFQIRWTETSSLDLELIFEFYLSKSLRAAGKIVGEIIDQVESIDFTHQYQQDEINPKYRRIIIRHFKVLYRVDQNVVYITRIFDTRQNPKKQIFKG